jgi:hypothetical protein
MYIRSYFVWVSQLWYELPGGCKLDILDSLTVFVDFSLFREYITSYILTFLWCTFCVVECWEMTEVNK